MCVRSLWYRFRPNTILDTGRCKVKLRLPLHYPPRPGAVPPPLCYIFRSRISVFPWRSPRVSWLGGMVRSFVVSVMIDLCRGRNDGERS